MMIDRIMNRPKLFSQRIMMQKPALDELKKDYTFIDMHIHTQYSHDSKMPVNYVLKKAELLGIGIAITDHKKAEGALEACKQERVLVIPGIEVASRENKEVLLYFYSPKDLLDYYEKYLKNKSYNEKKPNNRLTKSIFLVRSSLGMAELVEKADRYACLKAVPHPYSYIPIKTSARFFSKSSMADTFRRIDAIEVVNSTCRPYMNRKSRKWALRKGKAFIAGSDAHSISGVGSSFIACKANTAEGVLDEIKKKRNIIIGEEIGMSKGFSSLMEIGRNKRQLNWNEFN